jgi:2-amino-4-hydroxy-6-hydroxymethyldihydropteridine diphosphokinase
MHEVLVGLGSNVGDRLSHLKSAAAFLISLNAKTMITQAVRFSGVYESEPLGPGSYPYLNAMAQLAVSQPPLALLRLLKQYETEHGRQAGAPRWTDRTIDLDIIAWNDQIILEPELQIPHPSYRDRCFVLYPLKELKPAWVDPYSKKSIDVLIDQAMPLRIEKTAWGLP